MLTAIRSGRVEYDGELVEITAGRSRVDAEHEIALKAPNLFSSRTSAAGSTGSRAREDGAPDWWLDPYVPFVPREQVERTAKHEAAHAVAAHMLGWHVDQVVVRADETGKTVFYWEANGEPERRRFEGAVIAAAAEAYVGWAPAGWDYRSDRRSVRKAVQSCPDQRSQDIYRAEIETYTRQLVRRDRFRRLARQATDAVIDAGGVLEGERLREALPLACVALVAVRSRPRPAATAPAIRRSGASSLRSLRAAALSASAAVSRS
jgi:hypothetical protein